VTKLHYALPSNKTAIYTFTVFDILSLKNLTSNKHILPEGEFSLTQRVPTILTCTSQFHCSLSQNFLPSGPSSWQRLDITLWTSSKGMPSYWIWRRGWLSSRTLGVRYVQFSLIVLNLYCDNYIQFLIIWNAVQGRSFTAGVRPILSSRESIFLNILRLKLSNCYTIIFVNLSVGKN
jgi:hypothetical protein